MLVVGGRDSASTRYNDLWSYDPQSDSWSQLDNGSVFFCTLEVESSLGCNKQHAVHPPVICGGLQEKPLETVPLGQIVAGGYSHVRRYEVYVLLPVLHQGKRS
ncbi:unnamed protein product [Durusdinium trenchii]|uniref:Uncharacterized protein n=1 Tax=Durusdinium trenchii TaxID=1381693 RepID=A0ABP0KBE5_9DINO